MRTAELLDTVLMHTPYVLHISLASVADQWKEVGVACETIYNAKGLGWVGVVTVFITLHLV